MEKSGDGLIQQSGRLGYEVSVGWHPSPPSSHLVTLPTLIIEVVHADSAISGRPTLEHCPLYSQNEMRAPPSIISTAQLPSSVLLRSGGGRETPRPETELNFRFS